MYMLVLFFTRTHGMVKLDPHDYYYGNGNGGPTGLLYDKHADLVLSCSRYELADPEINTTMSCSTSSFSSSSFG